MEEENITLRNFKLEPLKTDYRVTRKYRTQLVKLSSELTCEDMVPITYDVMFKTMLANTKRKKYLCRFFSLIFDISDEEAKKLFRYSKNELDKDSIHSRRNTVDLVGTLGNVKVNVEMNKTNTLLRNFNYFKEITKEEILSGTEIKRSDTLAVQINLTDLCFKGDKTVNYFWYRDESGRGMDNKVLVNICIPLIRKKVYTEGVESLDDLERYVGMMSMEKVKKAKELAKGDELRMEYVKEVKRVEKSTNFYDDFDYEATLISNYIQDGMVIGREEGRTEERKKTITKMAEIGLPIEKIIECFDLSEEEIEDLKSKLKNSQ